MSELSTPSTLEPMARKLAYRVHLEPDDIQAILALPHVVKTIERNQFIVREREIPTHSCVMLSGFSVRSKLVGSGDRQIVAIHMKGEMVDLQNSLLEVADHSVQALTGSKVALIPRQEIVRLSEQRPKVGRAMWIDTLVEGSICREWVTNVGRRNARTRIAHLFCEFSLRLKLAGLDRDNGYELPMTQEQIGDATGLTSVHVNRTIKALEAERLIERANPRSIHIGDWRKLADVGDFDSTYLHLRPDEPALS
ncbi:MAG TPA: Crp/Fnr family transcriptional regulator [Sphingomicrobium sp.]|nr:Crp/Fnr family transcriptional regulator [Sphingomicrobium sp.]